MVVATGLFIMKKSISLKLDAVEKQLEILSERLYQPQITASDQKKIIKHKNKLEKEKNKLIKKMNINAK